MTCTAPCSTVEVLGEDAFTEGAQEWEELLRRSYDKRLFLTADWLRIWWEHFGSDRPFIYVSRSDSGQLEGILPLQVREEDEERIVTLAGDHNVADYMDAIADREHARHILAQLWTRVFQHLRPDRLQLRHVPSGSDLIPALEESAAENRFVVTVQQDEVAPVAILCSSWDGYLQTLTKKQRHEIRRKLRRAQEGVAWEWVTARTHEELDAMLATFFRLHELSGGEKERFMTPDMRQFFVALSHHLLARNQLRLSVFRREGIDMASTMSFVYGDRFLLY